MRYRIKQVWVLVMLIVVGSCGPKEEPEPALPNYFRLPATLEGYEGSGRISISISGGPTLVVEGPEQLNPATNTWSGVLGDISQDQIGISFTDGQPLRYRQTSTVPNAYQASGRLAIIGTTSPGTYPLNALAPTPRGEFADLVLNLPGPQVYGNTGGSLTIDEKTLIKTQDNHSLYRVQGTFQGTLYVSGVGRNPSDEPSVTGTFDVLLVD